MYTEKEVRGATLKYFNDDELATNVFMTKYCLRDNDGEYMEKSPDDMHLRLGSSPASKISSRAARILTLLRMRFTPT